MTYTPSQLLALVNQQLIRNFGDVYVEGEVTNCTRSAPGHYYFSIKDRSAQLSVVLFGMNARALKFRIENGLNVIVRGKLNVYEQRGTFQLNAIAVEPAGLGALQLAFEQLKAKLAAEGLFEESRKKPIPQLPQRIAVVTSPTGAAIRDIIHVLGRRFQGLSIQIYPVRVQGPTASREIAAALHNLSRWDRHDVILICRGGGSLEDLWPFNEEIVARAVAACVIPTISGVGHETDFTICDFVADKRAPTPSAAAEIVIRAKEDICTQIDQAIRLLWSVVELKVRTYRQELRHLRSSDGLGRVETRVRRDRLRLQQRRVLLYRLLESQARKLRGRLNTADLPLRSFPSRLAIAQKQQQVAVFQDRSTQVIDTRLARHRAAVRSLASTLQAVSPLSVLARGYAIAFAWRKGRKRPVQDSAGLSIGEQIEVQLRKGRLNCTVDEKTMGLESLWPIPTEKP